MDKKSKKFKKFLKETNTKITGKKRKEPKPKFETLDEQMARLNANLEEIRKFYQTPSKQVFNKDTGLYDRMMFARPGGYGERSDKFITKQRKYDEEYNREFSGNPYVKGERKPRRSKTAMRGGGLARAGSASLSGYKIR